MAQPLPHWLDRYTEHAEKYRSTRQAERENREAAAQARLRPTINSVLPPPPPAGKKVEERRDQTHPPLLRPPNLPPGPPAGVQMHFIDAPLAPRHHPHEQDRRPRGR